VRKPNHKPPEKKRKEKKGKEKGKRKNLLSLRVIKYQAYPYRAVYGGLLFSGNRFGEVSPEQDLHLFAVPRISNCTRYSETKQVMRAVLNSVL